MRTSGSFSGSWRRAAAGAARASSASPDSSARASGPGMAALFPVPDLELRLKLSLAIVDLELEVLRPYALLELDRGAALVGAVVGAFAAEEGHQLVLTDLEVAEVEPLYAAFEQGLHFARRVEIVDDFLAVDLELHGVESEEIADIHREEYRHLGVGREQQLLFQHEEVAVEIHHILLQSLHLFIEPAGIGGSLPGRRSRRSALGGWRYRRGGRCGGGCLRGCQLCRSEQQAGEPRTSAASR